MTLLFDGLEVGRIEDAFANDETWHGKFLPTAEIKDTRVTKFISFCENWNEQLVRGAEVSADDFVPFGDLVKRQLWETSAPNNRRVRIADAPNFFTGGEISWKYSK